MQTTVAAASGVDVGIIPLAEAGDRPEVGGKAARLGNLIRRGERVPDGFCVLGHGEPALRLAVEAYRAMGPESSVAVRSSASAEDGSEASFAGQFETVLNVRGEEALAAALRTCWASLSSDRVSAYLARHAPDGARQDIAMAVLIQRMVPARAAGVAFSADPLTGARDRVVIHAVPALGDTLVSGEADPDRWRVSASGEVDADVIGPGGPALSDDEAREIAAMVGRIAETEGRPQDVEWAIDAAGLWLLQARPLTALPPEVSWESPIPGAKWTKDFQTAEWQTEPPSPLGATTTFETMAVARERYRGWPPIPRSYEPGHVLINGWLYMRIGGPMWTLLANVAGAMLTLLTFGLDGDRRVRRRWPARLAELDELSLADASAMDVESLRRHVERLLDALGWWFMEVSYFAAIVRVGQMLVARPSGLTDSGALFRGNDSRLLESERALRRAAEDPSRLADYLARHGHMVESADPIHPTLAESPAAQRWQLAAARADRQSPDERLARASAQRADAERAIRRIRGPRGFLARRLTSAGQTHAAHTDDAVDALQRVLALLRAAFLAQGRRLVETGILGASDDVFYLQADEVWTAEGDRRELVETRRALREGRKKLAPPPVIPPLTDPSWAEDRMLNAMPEEVRAQLLERGLQVRDGREVLVGTAASPGVARGIARVVAGPDDFGRFQVGDVLVAHATSPMWTPLLAIAAAAVTEVGGPISHAAIVAREFGIPLVEGAIDATRSIADGTPVTVDGTRGVVELPTGPEGNANQEGIDDANGR
jgi:pyruvate,water dikinase